MSVHLITGVEEYLIHEYLSKIKTDIEYPEMNLSIFNEYDEAKVVEACEQLPFMRDTKVVICFGDIFAKANPILINYCYSPSPSTELYLVTNKIDKRKKLYKEIEKKGKIIQFNKLKPKDYIEFLRKYFDKNGIAMSNDIIQYIAEKTMYNLVDDYYLYDVVGELNKLIDFAGSNTVDAAMVDKIVKSPVNSNIFRLIHNITSGKKDVINQVSQLLNEGVEVMYILGMLLRHYRILYKYLVSNGKGLGLAPFQLNEFKNSYLTKDEALLAIELITLCQNDIKSGKIDMKLGLEILLVKLLS